MKVSYVTLVACLVATPVWAPGDARVPGPRMSHYPRIPPQAAPAQRARQNGISATRGWSRATAPRAEIGAGFLTLHNRGRQADRLLSATSPRSARVEIHTMTMEGGIMRMRPLPNGIKVPAGGTIGLAPGGNHLMLIGLKSPLKSGERVPVTLRFARSGAVRVRLAVASPGATAPANHGEQH